MKYDLEFDIDPLFHKTSAKFDESAAKGLLLNNLFVNRHLKIDFSSFREDFSSDIIEEHFQEKTLIKYENFNDLKINCIVSTQELKNLEICNKMEHILQHMRMQIEHIDKYELIKDEEVNEEELFEDSFHLNQIVDVSNQSLLGNDNSKKILPPKHHKKKHFEKSLIFEDLEERNHKIGIGRVRRGLFLKNEEYVSNNKKKKGKGINKSRAKEISRNSLKRSRRRNTTVLSISFNMEVEVSLKLFS